MIRNLFIIGNGFDIGHNLKTSGTEFRKWLKNKFNLYEDSYSGPEYPQIMPDGSEHISDEDLADFLFHCIEECAYGQWNQFEKAMGEIEWELFYDEVEDVMDRDGDIDLFKTCGARESFSVALSANAYASFFGLFSQWINTIEYPKDIMKKTFLNDTILNCSLFLTFNYTKTLEDIYQVPDEKVCHIHGVQNGEIIIGHGGTISSNENCEHNRDFGMEAIDEIDEMLRKPTEKILASTDFFSNLKKYNISDIYSWGFSFSDVDLCYVKEIFKFIETEKAIWHLHDYNKTDCEGYRKILEGCGFKGEITTFSA